jgi:hypothetical protein
MAKTAVAKKLKFPRNTLPYVQAAAFCEQILEDKDGVMSAIRMFDRVSVPTPGAPPPGVSADALPAIMVKVLLLLKSGSVKGRKNVKVLSESPNGFNRSTAEASADFSGDEWGVNLQFQMSIPLEGEGLYWCNVLVGNALVTRMPLRITYVNPPPERREPEPPPVKPPPEPQKAATPESDSAGRQVKKSGRWERASR